MSASMIIRAGLVVTMDAERRVLRDGAVAIDGDRITAVGPASEVQGQGLGQGAGPVHHFPDGVVLPGMIDGHQHLTGDRLVRASIPDDITSQESIFEWAVPVHEHHTPDDDELSATLTAVEAACNGVTTLIEAGTVAHPERVAAGLAAVGIRARIGTWGWDVPGVPYGGPTDEVLDRQAAVLDKFPPGGLITGGVTLVGHDLMSDELLVGASDLARERGAGLTFHISPHDRDAIAWVQRTGERPLVHFRELGALGRHVLLAHAVHLDDAELEAVLATGTAVVSCPWAYLRLAQGMTGAARHWDIVTDPRGRLALGCDSENAGDQVDVLRAAALFAGLGRDIASNPAGPGAHTALELATVRGAAAVGLDDIGSLTPGFAADLVVFDGSGPEWTPPGADPALQLVWGTDGRSVRDVMVAGRWIVRERQPTGVDPATLREAAREASAALVARSGVRPRSRWPIT